MATQDTNSILLDVNNIEVVYNDIIQVLRGVSLNVPRGGIVALLGTNGAGKTTTLRAISGLLKPENGFIKDGYIKFGDKRYDPLRKIGLEFCADDFINRRKLPVSAEAGAVLVEAALLELEKVALENM